MAADLSITGEVVVTSENAEAAFERVNNKATQMAKGVENAADKASKATEGMGDGAEKSADKFTRAESRMRDAIKRSTQELQLLGKTASEKLEFNIQAKGLDASKFAPYIEELKKAEQAQKIAISGLDNMGMSAKATAAAMRNVPAQFQDIIVSLQGGQAPMTVFLQQGSQLSSMFGGAGNAAKALGGYVLGLINPFTLAAVAVGGLGLAYAAGSKEADGYRQALVLTGNQAGSTVGQMQQMAQQIAGVTGSQSEAAAALAEFASSGKVGQENLRQFTQTAIEFSRVTGQSVDVVAKNFADLAKDPLKATLKLNESMNYLTESIFRQIQSLQDQGRETEAANVAQKAYADTLDERKGEIVRNLGAIEKAWAAIKKEANSAMDSILDIGRLSTLETRLLRAQSALQSYQSTLPGQRTTAQVAALEQFGGEEGLKREIAGLQDLIENQRKSAKMERERAAAVKASTDLATEAAKYDSDLEKQRRAVLSATEKYQTALAKGNLTAEQRNQLEADYLKLVSGITAAKEKKGGSGGLAAENKDLRDQQRIFAELADVSSTYYADLATAQQQRAKGNLSEAQYVKYVEELIQKQPFAVAAAKAHAEAIKEEAKAAAESSKALSAWAEVRAKESQGLQNQINARREEVSMMDMTAEAVAAYTQAKYEQQAAEKEAYAAALESASFYAGEYAEAYNIAAEAARQQAKQLRELGGLEVEKVNRVAAKKAKDEWERAADDINRSLTDALMRGFESGKDFAKNMRDTVVNMFKTMVLRPVISAVMSPVAGAINGMLYGNAAAAAGGGASALGMLGSGANLISGLQGTSGMLGTVGGWLGLNTAAANAGLAATIGIDAASAAAAANGAAAAGSTGLFSGMGAALPWIGGIAALASIISGLDDSGTYHTGGAAQYSAATGLRTSLGFRDNEEGLPSYNPNDNIDNQFGTGFGYVERGDQTIDVVSNLARGLGMALDGVAVAFGEKAGYAVATAFADDTSKDGAWGALRISKDGQELLNWQDTRTSRWAPKEFGDGEAGYKEYLAAVAKDTRQVLLDMDLPSWADKMLESIGESASMEQLSATVQQIAAIKTQFVQLGKAMEMFGGISSGMESALLSAAGSIDALTASAAGYYDAVYTEQEKIARARTQLETTLAGYGQSLPATREQYRALVEQQMAAGESGAEFAVVLMGLAGTFAQVADDIDAQFADLAKSAADVFSPLLESIKQARADVAGTRADMLASAQVMTPAQIAAAVNAAMAYAPNTAGIVSAQGGVASAASQVATSQAALDAARAAANTNQQSILAGLNKAVAPRTSAPGMTNDSLWEEIIGRNWQAHVARFGKGWNTRTTTDAERAAAMNAMAREYADAKNADVYAAANWQSGQDAPAIAAAQSALAAAQAALAAAQQAEVQARADYAAQLNSFVLAASNSVGKLSSLREEVVRYYEEQAAAVQAMISTAENLRAVVNGIRMGQLDSAQTASQLGNSYAMDYSMALAATGTTRAGYADSMASTLPTLAEAIKAEAISASDWRVQTGKLLAQATGVAGMLEADAAGSDYQTTSLGLLDSIDTALAQLEGSTKSAEQVISQAIKDGTTAQLTGLRAVVAALRGDPIPAFATGGFHAGGLRLVGENGPELEATGPSRIWSAQQTAALFAGNGQGSNEALVSEIRALRSENQAQAAAMVNMQRELNKLMQRWDSQGMPEVRNV